MTTEPQDVRVILASGEEVPCSCLREPALDRDGITYWIAVPLRELDGKPAGIRVADLPDKSAVRLDLAWPARDGNGA